MSAPLIHGQMIYRCEDCGQKWHMHLEIGVEDFGKNGRPHQPCPMFMRCECGGTACDISGYLPYPFQRPIFPGMRYFAYDHRSDERACGRSTIYTEGRAG